MLPAPADPLEPGVPGSPCVPGDPGSPDCVPGAPADPGWPDVVPGLAAPPDSPLEVFGAPPDEPPGDPLLPLLDVEPLLSLGGVGQPGGRGVPAWPLSVWPPSEPVDPAEPLAPPPWVGDEDGEEDDEPELPLDGDPDGVCELEPPPPEDDGDDGDDDEEPPDEGDGMPLGIDVELVVLQPASVSAMATTSSVDKPWERCIMETFCVCAGDGP